MSHRLNMEHILHLRRIENQRPGGPSISQEELDAQKARFLAAGGQIQEIPTGMSGEVFRAKRTQKSGEPRVWSQFSIKPAKS